VQAEGHQVIHHVVTGSDGGKDTSYLAGLFGFGNLLEAEMGGLVIHVRKAIRVDGALRGERRSMMVTAATRWGL
jgi:hypothetical protein